MTTTREELKAALAYKNETEQDIILIMHHPRDKSWENSETAVTYHKTLDTVPNVDAEYDAGFGTQEGDNVIMYTERHVYFKLVYDGSENIVALASTPTQAQREYDNYVPVVGS